MDFDPWAIQSTNLDKAREFVLVFRDSNLKPGEKGWQETSVPMSEEQLRQTLNKLNVPSEGVEEEIAKARKKS